MIDENSPLYPVYELIEEKKIASAIETINNMLETDPDSFDLYNLKGLCFYNLRRYGEAAEVFNKSIEIYGKDYYPFEMKGKCLFFLSKFFDSIDAFDAAYHKNASTNKRIDLLLSAGFVSLIANDMRVFDYFPKAHELDKRLTIDAMQEIFEKIFLKPVMELTENEKLNMQKQINELRENIEIGIKEAKKKIVEWGLTSEETKPRAEPPAS